MLIVCIWQQISSIQACYCHRNVCKGKTKKAKGMLIICGSEWRNISPGSGIFFCTCRIWKLTFEYLCYIAVFNNWTNRQKSNVKLHSKGVYTSWVHFLNGNRELFEVYRLWCSMFGVVDRASDVQCLVLVLRRLSSSLIRDGLNF